MHIVDVVWKPNKNGFISGLNYWDENHELSFLELAPKTEISWTVNGPRRCIGRRNDYRELVHCPFNSLVVKGKKCSECSDMDGFDPCIRCTGLACNASPFRYKECESSDYVLYLAYFSDGSLKVGVSSSHRVRTRWVEQGADYACIIAHVIGGDKARRLEYQIGKSKGVRMAVSGSTKANSILSSPSFASAEHAFRDLLRDINCSECDTGPEVVDLSPHYHLEELEAEPATWPDRSKPIVGQQTQGTILGMKGSLLVTYIGHAYRIISLKKFVGYTIENGIDRPVISQTGLLDFI